MEKCLSVESLGFQYSIGKTPVLEDISFSLSPGEVVTLCGATGSGKSTLLRLLKPQLSPLGESKGTLLFRGRPLKEALPSEIGFVFQHPKQQIVTDRVFNELAFGLENMGLPSELIRRRTAEMCGFFGIGDLFDREVETLSGGQQQLLNLAAVTAMRPSLLLLDEPTAQLDPIAADEFMTTLKRLNEEFSITILLAEHQLELALPISSRMLVLKDGHLIADGEKRAVCGSLSQNSGIFEELPAAARIFSGYCKKANLPLTVLEGRAFLASKNIKLKKAPEICRAEKEEKPKAETVLSLSDVHFRYTGGEEVLRGTELNVQKGEILCILGGNGSGKTTALGICAGILTPQSGKVRVFGKKIKDYKGNSLYENGVALLPQDAETLFLRSTVKEELAGCEEVLTKLPFDLKPLLSKHPYDLSGGEQQLVALCKVLSTNPRLLLLDEPTKGVDAASKEGIAAILCSLREKGVSTVIVTHDAEFASQIADRCALFFRGEALCTEKPHRFFDGNVFYTTPAKRVTQGTFQNVITVGEASKALAGAKEML